MQKSCWIILISNVDKKILLVRHKEWHRGFPKWAQEEKENDIETALRELYEETWITPNYLVSNIKLHEEYTTNNGGKEVFYFIWYVNRKNVKINKNELVEYSRDSLDQIKNNSSFLSITILDQLGNLLSKELVLKYNNINENFLVLNYKLQWSKHAYSRVAALSYLSWRISFSNVPNILDVWILDEINALSDLSWKTLIIPKELSSKSRSIIPLLPGLLYKHDEVILNFPRWCSIGERKIDLYLDILEKFWNEVIYDGYNIIIKKKLHSSLVYDFYFPSFSWTSIAITHASFIRAKTILNNISIEPEILFLIDMLKKCGVSINFVAERSIEIIGIDFSSIDHEIQIPIPDDRNVLVTKIILSIISKREFHYKSNYDLCLSPFLLELEKIWIDFSYDKYSIKINSNQRPIRPINILADFYPGICSDWQPFISLLLLTIWGKSIIKDSVFEDRYKYIKEVSKIIPNFSYSILGNALELVWWIEPNEDNLESEIECLDLRSGVVNAIGCVLSPLDEIIIKNIYQINRWYENILWDMFDVLWVNKFRYEYE